MKKTLIFISIILLSVAIQAQCVSCSGSGNTGYLSSIFGKQCQATMDGAFASGYQSLASGRYATSMGFQTEAAGQRSVAIGYKAKALDISSISLGSYVTSNKYNAIVLGSGLPVGYLINNIDNSLMIGFNSIKPSFYVGPAPIVSGNNATGKIGIGTIEPSEKLHIKADAGEVAAMFIEPNSWDNKAQAHLWLGNTGHGITADYRGGLVFRTQAAYLFNDGKVGIGTGEEYLPEEKLDVVGTVKMTGLRLQNKDAQTGHVLICSGINGEAIWKDPSGFSVWSVNEHNEAYRMSYVGIGTDEPQEMLDVAGNILVNDAIIGKIPANKEKYYDPDFFTLKGSVNTKSSRIMLPKGNNPDHNPIKILNPDIDGGIQFMNEGVMKLNIRRDEVVFGRPDHTLQVKVNGKIWANEVEVQLTDWWDEVFDDNYKLMPLLQLESYIEANNHLPDIPTEKDVLENGIELGEMNALLLKKVEELTLYVIELKKEMEAIKQQQNTQTANYKGSND